ncbi:MAG: hypothetical protein JWN75_242 [Candidatus Saccharibacteria bacterium]|nr:hypothetical protein [Candidatus Saccharibacteria bacterium]
MSDKPSAAFLEIEAKRTALAGQLFEVMVKDNWYSAFATCFRDYGAYEPGAREFIYHDQPQFDGEFGRCYLGGRELLYEARAHKARALGTRFDDDRFKAFIEEVLHDELEKFGVVLQWQTRHNWDGSDRVLRLYHKSEKVPPAT